MPCIHWNTHDFEKLKNATYQSSPHTHGQSPQDTAHMILSLAPSLSRIRTPLLSLSLAYARLSSSPLSFPRTRSHGHTVTAAESALALGSRDSTREQAPATAQHPLFTPWRRAPAPIFTIHSGAAAQWRRAVQPRPRFLGVLDLLHSATLENQ